MFERELTQTDAERIQRILEWLNQSGEELLQFHRAWPSKMPEIDKELFIFYVDRILLIRPRVVTQLTDDYEYIHQSAHLEKYLAEGGFLNTFKIYQDKKTEQERYQKLVVEDLETSIKTSKEAIQIARESNDLAYENNTIAENSKKYALGALVVSIIAALISIFK